VTRAIVVVYQAEREKGLPYGLVSKSYSVAQETVAHRGAPEGYVVNLSELSVTGTEITASQT
jgi:hypothetical protein